MIRVRIAGEQREGDEIDPSWINQQINRRRAQRLPVCVEVIIESHFNLSLCSAECQGWPTNRDWQPNSEQQKVIDLWREAGINGSDFQGSDLRHFLNQIWHLA